MIESTVLALGPLHPFHAAGVLGLPDVHVATGLCRIAGVPIDREVALAAALCVRALREGSVCIDLARPPTDWAPEEIPDPTLGGGSADGSVVDIADLPWPQPAAWIQAIGNHPLVAMGPDGPQDRPLRVIGSRLYLQRYWADEQVVAREIARRSRLVPVDVPVLGRALQRLFPGAEPDRQRLAAATAALRAVTIVAGGPGTGKTTTVAQLLAVLRELHGERLTVALVAPTGKAAARLQEAVAGAVAEFDDPADRRRVGEVPASTVHRLLGWRPGFQGRFRHDRGNPLPHDVVVVDETSMVSLSLMARLLEALRPDAQLVLVGDPDQLASIDAGAVLGDLVAAQPAWADPRDAGRSRAALEQCCPQDAATGGVPGVVLLDRTHRYTGAIAALASAVRAGDAERAFQVLTADDPSVRFLDTSDPAAATRAIDEVRTEVVAQAAAIRTAAERGAVAEALAELDRARVLCAHRRGPAGVAQWNAWIAEWTAPVVMAAGEQWWIGRPLLVTANDYAADVYNGDTGVVVADPETGQARAAFPRGGGALLLAPARLQQVETLHAMTIHRGQGSQFRDVTVVLPPPDSPRLTRELLYTAITRARAQVRVIATPEAIRVALARPVRRASGLRERSALTNAP